MNEWNDAPLSTAVKRAHDWPMAKALAACLVTFAISALLGACENDPPIRACPTLEARNGRGELWTWFGVVGPPGSAEPGELVRLYYPGDERWGDAWYATRTGSFALRAAGRVRRVQPGAVLELTQSGVRYSVRPGESEARIEYTSGTRPVMDGPPGSMTFSGWLERTSVSTPMAAAWAADWQMRIPPKVIAGIARS